MHLGVLYPPCHQRIHLETLPFRHPILVPPTPPSRRPSRGAADSRRRPTAVPSGQDSAASNGGGDVHPNPSQKRAEIQANVERAATMVGEIVDEVTREMFVSEAVAFLQEDQADQSELAAVRTAVTRRLEFMDANFLTALTGFIRACEARGDSQLASLLAAVHDEVLRQVAGRMPAAAQVLDLALRHADRDQRAEILRAAAAGGSSAAGAVPPADLDTLAATASKFIDEMEEQPQVPDRALLARLVLVREELRLLREEARFNAAPEHQPPEEPLRSNVPQRCAAFLKELVAVGEPLRRVGLLAQAFEADWEGAAPRQKPQTAFHANQPDWVRPGRFLATLQSMVAQLQQQQQPEAEAQRNVAVLVRLEAVRGEALAVLDRMQNAGAGGGGGGGGEGGSGSGLEVVEPTVVV